MVNRKCGARGPQSFMSLASLFPWSHGWELMGLLQFSGLGWVLVVSQGSLWLGGISFTPPFSYRYSFPVVGLCVIENSIQNSMIDKFLFIAPSHSHHNPLNRSVRRPVWDTVKEHRRVVFVVCECDDSVTSDSEAAVTCGKAMLDLGIWALHPLWQQWSQEIPVYVWCVNVTMLEM